MPHLVRRPHRPARRLGAALLALALAGVGGCGVGGAAPTSEAARDAASTTGPDRSRAATPDPAVTASRGPVPSGPPPATDVPVRSASLDAVEAAPGVVPPVQAAVPSLG